MDPVTGLGHLRTALGRQRRVLAGLADSGGTQPDLEAPVAACPGWTLRDLVFHLGENHRWACGAITEGHPDTQVAAAPADRAALLAWYDEGAAALTGTLEATDPGARCWTFGPEPALARFWFRRLAHEHTVHAWDVALSQGLTMPVDPELARDGIDEVTRMFFPRQVRLRRIPPLTRSLALCPDGAGTWLLAGDGTSNGTGDGTSDGTGTGDGRADQIGDADPAAADAALSGPPEALYLLLWGRLGLAEALADGRLAASGDLAAAEEVLTTAIVP